QTNIEFLKRLIADPDVRAGHLDTGLSELMLPEIDVRTTDDDVLTVDALVAHSSPLPELARPAPVEGRGAWHRDGWRLGPQVPSRYQFAVSATEQVDVFVTGPADAASVTIGEGDPRQAGPVWRDESTVSLELADEAR